MKDSSTQNPIAASVHNPAASARRRLLLAIGGGAGVATLHKLSNSGWIKPVVNTALLPVHAGGSNVRTPLNCPITICAEGTAVNTLSASTITLYLISNIGAGNNIMSSTTIDGISTTTVSLCATATIPTGVGSASYTAQLVAIGGASASLQATATCCYTSAANTAPVIAFYASANDEGECTVASEV